MKIIAYWLMATSWSATLCRRKSQYEKACGVLCLWIEKVTCVVDLTLSCISPAISGIFRVSTTQGIVALICIYCSVYIEVYWSMLDIISRIVVNLLETSFAFVIALILNYKSPAISGIFRVSTTHSIVALICISAVCT